MPYERIQTRTRFETEAKGNSEIAYLEIGLVSTLFPTWTFAFLANKAAYIPFSRPYSKMVFANDHTLNFNNQTIEPYQTKKNGASKLLVRSGVRWVSSET